MILRTTVLALLAMAWAGSAAAQRPPSPAISAAEVKGLIGADALEGRLDGDLNGDGDVDTVFVQRGEETRKLKVMLAHRTQTDLSHDAAGVLELDPYPLGPASLEIRKGVLVVEDLTGGTSATAATYRYRFDPATRRMKLIGLDAKFYSRTNAHGWNSVSWNLLTGAYVKERADLIEGSDGDYRAPVARRSKRPVKAVFMEQTPSADGLVMAPGG